LDPLQNRRRKRQNQLHTGFCRLCPWYWGIPIPCSPPFREIK
jgi:hypothetical protein